VISTPWEVALRYAAGELSHEQLIETFTAWPWTHDRFLDADSAWPEQYVRGSWQDLVRPADEGYISRQDYALLFERCHRDHGGVGGAGLEGVTARPHT